MKRKAFNIQIVTTVLTGLAFTGSAFAQNAAATAAVQAPAAEEAGSILPGVSATHIGLYIVALLLVVVIGVLASVLKGLSRQQTNIQLKKHEGDPVVQKPEIRTTWVRGASAIALLLLSTQTFAQRVGDTLVTPKAPVIDWGMVLLLTFIVAEFAVILALVASIRKMMVANGLIADAVLLGDMATEAKKVKAKKQTFMNRWLTRAVPIENEATITFDHEYDGIRELDNSLPPWWLYGFYISIVFGVIYLLHYHVFDTGQLSAAELKTEYAKAEEEKNAMMKNMAAAGEAAVTEESVTILTDASAIANGKASYDGMCATCHGNVAQGNIGPNLTDDYWIYGGSIKNIFKTITNGTPNGMQSWKSQLSPKTIQEVGSYIKSLRGSNPAGAKAPQGELYKEEEASAKTDTTASAKADTAVAKAAGGK